MMVPPAAALHVRTAVCTCHMPWPLNTVWCAEDTRLEWGGLISTCNQLTGGPVEVDTDAPLLWTTSVPT